jgi:hypothetical protein
MLTGNLLKNQRLALNRIANTVRYYDWNRIIRRAATNITSLCFSPTVDRYIDHPALEYEFQNSQTLVSLADLALNDAALYKKSRDYIPESGTVVLLAKPSLLGNPIDWQAATASTESHLWRFQLHYHEFLLSLARCTTSLDAQVATTIGEWIKTFPPASTKISQDAWHPYCISRRCPCWLILRATNPNLQSLVPDFKKSLSEQVAFLANNMEYTLGGNHLLENYFSLAIFGLTTEGPASENALKKVETNLVSELERQLTDHGEHFELAPTYHCQVTGQLLRILSLAEETRSPLATPLRPLAERLLEFLTFILGPNDEIPLLGDSTLQESFSIPHLKGLASLAKVSWPKRCHSLCSQKGPYCLLLNNQDERRGFSILFDTGEVATPSLPGHGHADLLNICLNFDGKQILSDTGTFDYEDSEERQFARSSAAHNVCTISGENCADTYGKFRMGRRGKILSTRRGMTDTTNWVYSTHDGYRHLDCPILGRVISLSSIGHPPSTVIYDHAVTINRQPRPLKGFLQLHPGITPMKLAPDRWALATNDRTLYLHALSPMSIDHTEGHYYPSFGIRQQRHRLVYTTPPSFNPYTLLLIEDTGRSLSLNTEGPLINIVTADGEIIHRLDLSTFNNF